MNRRLVVLLTTLGLAACATRLPGAASSAPAPTAPAAPVPAPSPGGRVAAAAAAQIGQPYRWGGAAPGGFDCSGLVVYAAAAAGLRVPRTTVRQITAGVAIARSEVRSGDLVFLQLSRKDLHVGVALDNLRFVHAPSRGGRVRIDRLDATPYARAFVAARRIVGQSSAPAI